LHIETSTIRLGPGKHLQSVRVTLWTTSPQLLGKEVQKRIEVSRVQPVRDVAAGELVECARTAEVSSLHLHCLPLLPLPPLLRSSPLAPLLLSAFRHRPILTNYSNFHIRFPFIGQRSPSPLLCQIIILMSQVHDRLLDHYRAKSNLRETKTMKIESIVKQSIHRKQNEEDILSPYSDFLRNEEHLAA
jgi:hypothetical protein